MWMRAIVAVVIAGSAAAAWAAPPLATVTILDGASVALLRDTGRYALAEGVRLQKDDILVLGPQVHLVRIEFANGVIADLGPDTQLLLAPKLAGNRSKFSPTAYLMQGWVKLTSPASPTSEPSASLASLPLDIPSVARQAVVSVSPDEAGTFAEAGLVTLVERIGGHPMPPLLLKGDQFFSRLGAAKSTVSARPPSAFVSRVPRPFTDTLPSRVAMFANRDVTPKRLGDLSYADAQPWIDAEPALRPAALARWRGQVKVPEFRSSLAANMKAHPEWDRLVFPQKYLPRPSVDAQTAASVPR